MPRIAYKPTDRDRGQVEALVSYGHLQADIAAELGISDKTLRKYFPREIARSQLRANAKVAERLFADCLKDDPNYQRSRMFWMKTRAGWRETERVEHTLPEDTTVKLVVEYADKDIPD